MRNFFIFLLCLPFVASASTLHLADILAKGYHFSAVQYAAFNEPDSAKGKETEGYLHAIFKDAQLEIANNYVLLQNTDLNDVLPEIANSEVNSSVRLENEKNVLDFEMAKKCALRSLPQIKLLIFHQAMNRLELSLHLESTLRMERGLVKNMRLGLICGSYLGEFGQIQVGDLVEEVKVLRLVARESQKDVFRFLKLQKLYFESQTPIAMQLVKYLKTKILVESYKNKSLPDLDLFLVKEEFKTKTLNSFIPTNSQNISFYSSRTEITEAIDEAFKRVDDELL